MNSLDGGEGLSLVQGNGMRITMTLDKISKRSAKNVRQRELYEESGVIGDDQGTVM